MGSTEDFFTLIQEAQKNSETDEILVEEPVQEDNKQVKKSYPPEMVDENGETFTPPDFSTFFRKIHGGNQNIKNDDSFQEKEREDETHREKEDTYNHANSDTFTLQSAEKDDINNNGKDSSSSFIEKNESFNILQDSYATHNSSSISVDIVSCVLQAHEEVKKMSPEEIDVLSRITAQGKKTRNYYETICNIVNVNENIIETANLIVSIADKTLDERAFAVMSLSSDQREKLVHTLALFGNETKDSPFSGDYIEMSRFIVKIISGMSGNILSHIKTSVKLLQDLRNG